MNSARRHRPDLRDQGRRRVAVVTRSSLLAGTVLAAAFGIALALHDTATANAQPILDAPAAPDTPSDTAPLSATSTPAPSSPTTTAAPPSAVTPAPATLQPPVQAPTQMMTRSSHGRSGGS